MTPGTLHFDESLFNSRLSLRPLVEVLKKTIAEGKPGSQKLYGELVNRVASHPELLEPITDLSLLNQHTELVEMLLSTIFPPATSENETLYAVSVPFKFQTVYSSRLFQALFLKPGTSEINVPNDEIGKDLNAEKMYFAYALILKKYLGFTIPDWSRSVYPYQDPVSGLIKYLELQVDTRFVDVKPVGDMPVFPDKVICPYTNSMMPLPELLEKMPLKSFVFEGIAVVRINDVTEQEAISKMKNSLLSINSFSDASVYKELQEYMQSLIGLKNIRIGITPFFKVNGHHVYSELYNSNSLLFKHLSSSSDKEELSDCCKAIFEESARPIAFEYLDEKAMAEIKELKYYYDEGGRSIIISPLNHNGELIGVLEIVSNEPGVLKASYINKIEQALPLFTLALEKSAENLNNQIDRVIKEKFTAVQPAVEWKFTEAAFKYITSRQENEDARMDRIVFDEVFPLYGNIDIRNSSTERAHSIQLDIIEQLQLTKAIIKKAQKEIFFPLLQEIEFKIDKYISSASDILLSEDEIQIHDFLQRQITDVLEHLKNTVPSLKKDIAGYFAALDPQTNMIFHHRREYEDSVARINDTLARFVDKEQKEAQKYFRIISKDM